MQAGDFALKLHIIGNIFRTTKFKFALLQYDDAVVPL